MHDRKLESVDEPVGVLIPPGAVAAATDFWWAALRGAAVLRHFWLWCVTGANPKAWSAHMDVVRKVYGY